METTESTTRYTDPGLEFGTDIEAATLYIGRVRKWTMEPPYPPMDKDSHSWRILRAYGPYSVRQLNDMDDDQRFEAFRDLEPAMVYQTQRPAWATHSESMRTMDDAYIHFRPFLDTDKSTVQLQQIDLPGKSGTPEVLILTDSKRWTPPELMALAKACEAAAHHYARIGRCP